MYFICIDQEGRGGGEGKEGVAMMTVIRWWWDDDLLSNSTHITDFSHLSTALKTQKSWQAIRSRRREVRSCPLAYKPSIQTMKTGQYNDRILLLTWWWSIYLHQTPLRWWCCSLSSIVARGWSYRLLLCTHITFASHHLTPFHHIIIILLLPIYIQDAAIRDWLRQWQRRCMGLPLRRWISLCGQGMYVGM